MGRVGEYTDFQNGFAFKSKDFQSVGEYKVIKIKELKAGGVKFSDDTACVNYSDGIEKYIVSEGDVLFALTGDPVSKPNSLSWVGRVSLYNEKDKAVLNQRVCKLLPKESLNPLYLYYFFRNNTEFYQLAGKATGSASQANISTKTIADTYIDLPSLDYQNKVVDILYDIDSKIRCNETINQNLSVQIQTIYDKLIEEVDANPIEISSVIDVRDGTHDSPKAQETGLPLVTSKHLLPYGVDLSSPNKISKSDFDKINERSQVDTFDILLSMIGTVGIISLVVDNPVEFAIKNVGLFKTSASLELYPFVLAYLRSKSTMQHIEKVLAGSTQKYVSLGELRKLPITLPSSQQLKNFNAVVKPIIEQIIILTKESKQLTELRDSLLPKLMSGELDVSEIEL